VEKGTEHPVAYFVGVERGHRTFDTHLHALLNVQDELGGRAFILPWWELWFKRYGRAKVVEYEPARGAEYYLTKYTVKALCDWDLDLKKALDKGLELL